ncbi:hypothetical protein NPX13_g4040 [Xylaria arbuscula]|uniref:Uncharacterized protein n=1 Tax=Xylaria arbuscula TaxID=114810 RepID=A0A9W8NH37_9PEZI|nr:hypothetical protein NPX13_g4040 [Xylaria arbuscula]
MLFRGAAALLTLAPLAIATECTQSNAIDWPFDSTGSDPCADYCGNDSACLQACYETAEQGQCNAVGCDEKRATFENWGVYGPDGSVTTNLGDDAAAATSTSQAAVATSDSQGTAFTTPATTPTATASTVASPSATETNGVECRRVESWTIGASGLFVAFLGALFL